MIHIDLFSGIGGFALATDRVWPGIEHIFCDNDLFCQAILKKHWPNAPIYGDIRTFTNAEGTRTRQYKSKLRQVTKRSSGREETFILTGGFPCQPFSQAGRRQGTADDRYLWPEMFRVIREFQPQWIIAENVGGLVTWNNGLVLEQVCLDLEAENYEVQPFIIPAVAVNAPHRRDRVWIVANRRQQYGSKGRDERMETYTTKWTTRPTDAERQDKDATDTKNKGLERQWFSERTEPTITERGSNSNDQSNWNQNWLEVATKLCRVDDGLPKRLDRNPRLKALGNAIVPQVAEEIMKAINQT